MSDKLKPCPFCGGTDIYETYQEERSGYKLPIIFCNWCKSYLAVEDDSPYIDMDNDYKYRKAKTIDVWNKRIGVINEK